MDFRLANMNDLRSLKIVYRDIISNMNKENIHIWDEIYPLEFFNDDISNGQLYILEENSEILSAFVLSNTSIGADHIKWKHEKQTVRYIDRFGVNVHYLRKGIGSIMLQKAISLAKEQGIECLRLFVVDINNPAINLYMKNGFSKVDGYYDQIINNGPVLHEWAFELDIAK
jgi:ribosomal protein S18 acetylase RimI-like enzyme